VFCVLFAHLVSLEWTKGNNAVPGRRTPKKTASAQPKQESLSSVQSSQLFRYNPTSSIVRQNQCSA